MGTPTYNRPEHVRTLAKNILAIDGAYWILRDNGGNGALLNDLYDMGFNTSSLQYKLNSHNVGARKNGFNVLFDFSLKGKSGDFILIVGDDDLIDLDMVNADNLEIDKVGMCVFGHRRYAYDEKPLDNDCAGKGIRKLGFDRPIVISKFLEKTRFIDNLRLYSGILIAYDLAVKLVALQKATRVFDDAWYPMQLYAFEAEVIRFYPEVRLVIHSVGNEQYWAVDHEDLERDLTWERSATYKMLRTYYRDHGLLDKEALVRLVSMRYKIRQTLLQFFSRVRSPWKKYWIWLIYRIFL